MKVSEAEKEVLMAMARDHFLKSHRHVDGYKAYKLHPLSGLPRPVRDEVVSSLREAGLIDSNKKFPVATFWLTDEGRGAVADLNQD